MTFDLRDAPFPGSLEKAIDAPRRQQGRRHPPAIGTAARASSGGRKAGEPADLAVIIAFVFSNISDAKVDNLEDVVVGEEEVVGLDIAVDDAPYPVSSHLIPSAVLFVRSRSPHRKIVLVDPLDAVPPDQSKEGRHPWLRGEKTARTGTRGRLRTPFRPIYPMSEELAALQEWLTDALEKGWTQPSSSSAGAPIILAPREDGKLRICVGYRALNRITTSITTITTKFAGMKGVQRRGRRGRLGGVR